MSLLKKIRKKIVLFLTIMICFMPFLTKAQQFHVVGGLLSGEHVWGNDDIPYYVESNVFINIFGSLTILPGTKIYLDNSIGIYVNGGTFIAEGAEEKPIEFSAFSNLNWKDLVITNQSDVSIKHAHFKKCENGIEIKDSDNTNIIGCRFEEIYYNSISITNSDNCEISGCYFNRNYNAISISANGSNESCSNNIIKDNIFINGNKNIYINNNNNAKCQDNVVENNIFEGAPISVHFENSSIIHYGKNYVRQNVFYSKSAVANNPLDNISIYVSMDSLYIDNNIFWKGGSSIYIKNELTCSINKNTFYNNFLCINNIPKHKNILINNNVFLDNKNAICSFAYNTINKCFNNNNFIVTKNANTFFINYSSHDIDISDNFWSTTNDSIINNLIIDKNDNPIYGSIIYEPFMENHSLSAPISPPVNVTKQYIDDAVLIQWNANKESDLQHYRLYHGSLENYSFPNMIDAINDTSIMLYDININNDIAITSIDNDYDETNNQFLGHESAFSMAQLIPYAGSEDSMCQTNEYYAIQNATYPSIYNNLMWTSSGSGYFENNNNLNTKYFPSKEDFDNGQVMITLTVSASNGMLYEDSFTLKLIKKPTVYAGRDRKCFYQSAIVINDSYISDYDSLRWETSGDGFFEDDTALYPTYHYGYSDSIAAEVTLTLHAYSQCENKSDDVLCSLVYSYSMEGKVKHNGQNVANSVIIAASINNKVISDLYKTKSDSCGNFRFDRMIENNYLLYAIPDTLEKIGAPTYYANNSTWQDAYNIHLNADVYDIDVNLINTQNDFIKGRGSISGKFEYPNHRFNDSTFYCSAWYEQDSNVIYCDEGLSNAIITLYNKQKTNVISYDITDSKGNFSFKGLPYGSYYLISELPRYKTSNQYLINITEKNYKIERLIFYINENHDIILRSDNKYDTKKDFIIYPNPCDKYINIESMSDEGLCQLEIYNMLGAKIYNSDVYLNKDSDLRIPTESLSEGLYLIKIYKQDNLLHINKLSVSR